MLSKKALLLAPAVVGSVLVAGHGTANADEISTKSLSNIETKTVYYSGNESAKLDQNSQDSLVSNDHYQSEGGTDKGVSATILAEDKNNETHALLSEKAITEVNSSEKLTEADQAKLAEEQKAKEEEEAKKAEEARKAEEAKKAEANKKAKSQGQGSQYSSGDDTVSQTAVAGVDGSSDIQPSYGNNTYPVGQCTWGAKALAPWAGNYWGNARDWTASAQAAGFKTGSQPRVGAIIVWPYDGGGYGHVAVVTAVNGTQIQVKESNYAGNQYIANFRGWFEPTNPMWGGGVVQYIYPN